MEWEHWERQRRFGLEKRTNPLTGSLALAVKDFWQKLEAVIPCPDETAFEDTRAGIIADINSGHIPALSWGRAAGNEEGELMATTGCEAYIGKYAALAKRR